MVYGRGSADTWMKEVSRMGMRGRRYRSCSVLVAYTTQSGCLSFIVLITSVLCFGMKIYAYSYVGLVWPSHVGYCSGVQAGIYDIDHTLLFTSNRRPINSVKQKEAFSKFR